MENTLKTAFSPSENWRKEMKALLIKNGAKIRPIIGNCGGNRLPSEVRLALKEIQAEVKAELKEISYAVEIAKLSASVKKINDTTWEVTSNGHVHVVAYFPDKEQKWWCYDCLGFVNYRHCRHVDAVKFHREHAGETKLEEF
jgi:hypothetical protein